MLSPCFPRRRQLWIRRSPHARPRCSKVIRAHIAEHRRPPSRPELARLLGLASTNGVFKHLAALARKGAIELIPGSARGIRVKDDGGLPLAGRVAAGSPILAVENLLGRYQVDPAPV